MAIQFEAARQKVDPRFTKAAAELSDAYYNHWRLGKSRPWNGLDLLTKEQFDEAHGALWHLYVQALVAEIEAGSYGYDRDRYDPTDDEGKRRSVVAGERLAALEQRAKPIGDCLRTAIRASDADTDPTNR